MRTYFMSRPMLIGRHEWRLNIRDFEVCGQMRICTEYQWRKDGGSWRGEKEWPSYNADDTYGGLPKSLQRLYDANRAAVDLIIYGKLPDQLSLF